MIKIIIAGGRKLTNYEFLKTSCDDLIKTKESIVIVSGTANGADRLGEIYAKEKGYGIERFPADWDTYGKSAGYKRNAEMANYADALIAFWDGKSKGTSHMIDLAKAAGLYVEVVRYEEIL